jgi:hypothetical protein
VHALLTGADEGDVEIVLARLGVRRDDPSISVLVARHADLLGRHPLDEPGVDLVDVVGRTIAARGSRRSGEPGGRHAS